MNKRILLNILLASTFIGSVFLMAYMNNKQSLAKEQYQVNKSPSLNCISSTYLKNGEGDKVLDIYVAIDKTDQKLKLTFNTKEEQSSGSSGSSGSSIVSKLPELAKDEVYFAVLINDQKKIVENKFLTQENGGYVCKFDAAYNCDMVDVHIYKQKVDDPEFMIKAENFIGRTKILLTHDAVFYRPTFTQIPVYDNKGTKLSQQKTYLSRVTPNYYSLCEYGNEENGNIAKIVLPKDKQNLLTEDETMINMNRFYNAAATDATSNTNTARDGYYYDFYLPDGIDEFDINIYKDEVSANKDNILRTVHIKLIKE